MLILAAAEWTPPGQPPLFWCLNAEGSMAPLFCRLLAPGLTGEWAFSGPPCRRLPREAGLSFLASSTLS